MAIPAMLEPIFRMSSNRFGAVARRSVLLVSGILGLVGLYWIGRGFVVDGRVRFGNPVDVPVELEDSSRQPPPLQVRAEVARVIEGSVVRVGDKCEFLVERRLRDSQSYYCNAQVVCGGKLLYGGPERGFFACRFFSGLRRDVMGRDPSTTRDDQDAAMQLDTRTGVLRVWDDAAGVHGAFSIEAEVLSTH